MSQFSTLSAMFPVAVLMGLGACATHEPSVPAPSAYAPPTPTPEQYGSTTGPGPSINAESTDPSAAIPDQSVTDATMGSTMPQGADPETLDDSQIAAVVIALHLGAIQESQLAQSKATTAEVKHFATRVLGARQALLDKSQVDFSQGQIAARENDVSEQLETGARRAMATMQAVRGKDFDRDYVDWQVAADSRAFDLIDRMLPAAKSAPLRASLLDARSNVYNELRDAEAVQKHLSGERGAP